MTGGYISDNSNTSSSDSMKVQMMGEVPEKKETNLIDKARELAQAAKETLAAVLGLIHEQELYDARITQERK